MNFHRNFSVIDSIFHFDNFVSSSFMKVAVRNSKPRQTTRISPTMSTNLMKSVLKFGTSSIFFQRKLFPESYFRKENLKGGQNIYQLDPSKIVHDPEASAVYSWMEELYTGIDHQFLEEVKFEIRELPCQPKSDRDGTLFDSFSFKIHYDEKSSIVSMSVNLNQSEDSSKTTGFSKDDIQKSSHELFKIIWEANKVKKNFPRNRLINIFTIYDNERIPDDFTSKHFKAVDLFDFDSCGFSASSYSLSSSDSDRVSEIMTGFHQMEFYSLRQDEAVRALTKKVDPLNFPAEFTVDEYTECTNATVEDSIPLSTFKSQTSECVSMETDFISNSQIKSKRILPKHPLSICTLKALIKSIFSSSRLGKFSLPEIYRRIKERTPDIVVHSDLMHALKELVKDGELRQIKDAQVYLLPIIKEKGYDLEAPLDQLKEILLENMETYILENNTCSIKKLCSAFPECPREVVQVQLQKLADKGVIKRGARMRYSIVQEKRQKKQ